MNWLALDIGGANIKISDGKGYAQSLPFPLWQKPDQLSLALKELIAQAPPTDRLAVTMTGELADCFVTKAVGVTAILDAVEQAANGKAISVYLCDGRLVKPSIARGEALLAAASNWHVLADFATRFCQAGQGLLIDIGSTTSDIIPLSLLSPQGPMGPATIGITDPERLAAGELVYTGVQRSPVCAIVSRLPWRGAPCPVAQELFATTLDAYLLLGEIAADPENLDTADGRPATKPYAHARLARAICADTTMFSPDDAERAAKDVFQAQIELLADAGQQVLQRMPTQPATLVLSGQGEFLARRLVERLKLTREVVSLNAKLGAETSRAACAHALAVLAAERSD